MLLKTLKEAVRSLIARSGATPEYPLETERKLNLLHGRAPVDQHLDILFQDARIGEDSFVALHKRCLEHTGTGEWMCLIKSDAIRQRDVEREIRAIHSYELPGIIAVPIVGGDDDYLSWYAQSLEVAQPPRGERS